MTDLQLGTLLRQYSRRLYKIIEQAETMQDEHDLVKVWIGEGDEPTPPQWLMDSSPLPLSREWDNLPYNRPENWEHQPIGRLSLIQLFEDFAEQLEGDALALFDLTTVTETEGQMETD